MPTTVRLKVEQIQLVGCGEQIVFGNLKNWLNGVHHGVSPQHLQAYLNEFTFRFNRRFFPFTAFQSLLGIGAATEPTTYDALYNTGRPTPSGRESPVGD